MNGAHRAELDGCYDIDLSVTPFTNTLPIRRLPLHVGDAAELSVVYIDVDTLEVRPDRQRYTRLDTHRWAFEQLDTGFAQQFDVDELRVGRATTPPCSGASRPRSDRRRAGTSRPRGA